MCVIFCRVSHPQYQLFGITESRLDFRITDHSISIPDYHITRRDRQLPGQTGIAVSVHQSVQAVTHRSKDLKKNKTECIWLELKPYAWAIVVCALCVQKSNGYL